MKKRLIAAGGLISTLGLVPLVSAHSAPGQTEADNSHQSALVSRHHDRSEPEKHHQSNDAAEVDDDQGDEAPDDASTGQTVISSEQAQAIAQQLHPDVTIVKVELETEDGIQVFSIRFSDGSRVDINAADGSVVRDTTGHEAEDSEDGDDDDGDDDDGDDDDDSNSDSDSGHHDDGDEEGEDQSDDD